MIRPSVQALAPYVPGEQPMVFMEEAAATAQVYDTQTPTGLLSASIDVSVVFELN